ncbi:Arc family DNA-binding protein [Acinetobacter soli]|uniref:Arc family DNA-binding protein n=1 Tax=Acinetobacter soli TaxID=487316 RepID=UPI00124E93AD|nr:Arc family DNA-binding protein [Acinetobacter soli]
MSNNGGNLTIQYNLRWSEEMRDRIAAAAKENTRSMNQEIIARLEESFNNDISDSTLDAVISSFLFGLISKYESQKKAHLALIPKAELYNDENAIKLFTKEAERCDMLVSEIQDILRSFKSSIDSSI